MAVCILFDCLPLIHNILTPYCNGHTFIQFEPAPRRGEPNVTQRRPDYFI
ncbi:unnamed protein product [Rhodiola kirilowii]